LNSRLRYTLRFVVLSALGCGPPAAVQSPVAPAVKPSVAPVPAPAPPASDPSIEPNAGPFIAPGAHTPWKPLEPAGGPLWEYELTYERGAVRVEDVRLVCPPTPPRRAAAAGRFALEIGIGPETLERVRFDFPLLAAEAPEAANKPARDRPVLLSPGAHVTARVRVAADERAVWARLAEQGAAPTSLPWPPVSRTTSPCTKPAAAAQ
jgi:hypothetical protein